MKKARKRDFYLMKDLTSKWIIIHEDAISIRGNYSDKKDKMAMGFSFWVPTEL